MRVCVWGVAVCLAMGGSFAWALRDPTRPPDASAPAPVALPQRPLSLDSIVYGETRRVAVIDGVALREGQAGDGIKVRKIHRDRVEVLDGGQLRVLRLNTLPEVRETP
ncbi:hypothetical protein [Marinobacter lutaoensis]|uniref:MSHA biogenesis protein MshK n=1 Tax=Marinobacter lutaoensis TaxID=135739 RepID=A0A1V2DWJ0_9GAMM|nr:hypothetical protein [Marinobacter lutaoensis]NVD36782.1 hypothetical protein [Marinobacter lutaoensis]ONF44631.1 hypothetical protein BTO32_04070 [Marinobacter lutaoensis]